MARPGRKKTPAKVSLPGKHGQIVELAEVDDPFDKGAKISVVRVSDNTPLDSIYARGRLAGPDDSDADGYARKVAGEWVRVTYEKAEMSDSRAIDYSAVKVDVSFSYSGLSHSKAEALETLSRLAAFMDDHDTRAYKLVYAVCGAETRMDDYLRSQGAGREPGRMDRLKFYESLRAGLDLVIEFRGVSIGRGWKMRAEMM